MAEHVSLLGADGDDAKSSFFHGQPRGQIENSMVTSVLGAFFFENRRLWGGTEECERVNPLQIVQLRRYSPDLIERNHSWRVDETYLKVGGQWMYLYRVIKKAKPSNPIGRR